MSGSKVFLKDRSSHIFLGGGALSVKNGTLCFKRAEEEIVIPTKQFMTIFLEPGTSVSHSAVVLCSKEGCMLNWVGEQGVRFYSAGRSDPSRTDRLWKQAEMALNKNKRLSVARRMYAYRFNNTSSLKSYSLEQLSGKEASRVKAIYKELAEKYNIEWEGRSFDSSSRINVCLSTVNSCLYGLVHSVISASGYSPSMGFIHGRTSESFVFDCADLIKFQTVTRIAFEVASDYSIKNVGKEARIRCRNLFKEKNFVKKLLPVIDEMVGFNKSDQVERPAILDPFEFWPYADHINNKNS